MTLTILCYHGVTDARSEGIENCSGKHIARDVFAAQLRTLRERCTPLAMDDVVRHLVERRPFPPHAVAVTFDDGFQNNATVAAPLLEAYEIPATFYVATGFIGSDRMFWVDALEDCVNRTSEQSFTIALGGTSQTFPLANRIERIAALTAVKGYCKRVDRFEKNRVLQEFAARTGIRPEVTAATNYAKMTWDDVRALDANPLFTVGSHTVNHDILTALPPEHMRTEIDNSLVTLTRELGHPIRHFSYPEGQRVHYDGTVIAHLRSRGIVCSPSAIDGVNVIEDDPFHLKRIMVGFEDRPFPFPIPASVRYATV